MPVAQLRGTHPRGAFRGRLALGAGLAAVLLWGAGCSGRTNTPAMQTRPSSTAVLAFITPSPGAVISGTTLHVRLSLTGAVIVPQTSTNLSPDKGHIHLSLDGQVISMAYGVEQDVTVTPGPHILQAEFVATDHFPFNPRVLNTVTFTVR
jgi:hypothetical protein